MKPATRTRLALALTLPLAAIILAMFACLPVPVGDPDTSKVDNALSGSWLNVDGDQKMLALLKPWDAHTYLLQVLSTGRSDGKETHQIQHYKAWLTTMNNVTFITAQPMDEKFEGQRQPNGPGNPGNTPWWVVGRVNKTADGIDFRMINPDSPLLKDIGEKPTREQVETIIKAHLEEDGLYAKTVPFKHASDDDALAVLRKFNTE